MPNKVIPGACFRHAALESSRFDDSVRFYEALGFKTVSSWGEGDKRAVLMDIGDGGQFEIFAKGPMDAPSAQRFVHLAVGTTDADAAFAAAVKAGAKVHKEPYDFVIPASPAPLPVRLAFVYGPAGELIEFFQDR